MLLLNVGLNVGVFAARALEVQEQEEYLDSLAALGWLVDSAKRQEWEAAGVPLRGKELAAAVAVPPGSALFVTVLLLLGFEVIYETYRRGLRPFTSSSARYAVPTS